MRRAGDRRRSGQRRRDHLNDVRPSLVSVCPFGHGFAVPGSRQQLPKWSVLPYARPKDDWNYPSAPLIGTLHCACHLDSVAIRRRKKIGTDKQKDNVRLLELIADHTLEPVTGLDPSVIPYVDPALVFKHREMLVEFTSERLVNV